MKNKVLKGKVTHQACARGRTQKGNSPTFILAPLIACRGGGGETFFIRAFKSSPYMFHKQAKGKLDSTELLGSIQLPTTLSVITTPLVFYVCARLDTCVRVCVCVDLYFALITFPISVKCEAFSP